MKSQPTPAAAGRKKASAKKTPTKRIGRPPVHGQATKDKICHEIAIGRTLPAILRDAGMPDMSWVWRAMEADPAFRTAYTHARETRTEIWAEDLVSIADDGQNDSYIDEQGNPRTDHDHIARSRLRVDTRKWLASKLLPKTYGEKVTTEVTGAGGGPVQVAVAVELPAIQKALERVRGGT